jgi:hypothetical protein
MPHHRRLAAPLLFLASFSLAVAAFAPAAAQSPETPSRYDQYRQRFQGTWVLAVAPDAAQRTIDQAIDRAASAMSFVVRGVARPLLRDNTPVNRRIVLEFPGDQRLRARFPDTGFDATTRIGRTERARTQDGDPMRVTQRFRDDGSLEQVFQADRGTRWNVYRSEGDGRLVVESTVQGDMMPQPMRFSLRYRRR